MPVTSLSSVPRGHLTHCLQRPAGPKQACNNYKQRQTHRASTSTCMAGSLDFADHRSGTLEGLLNFVPKLLIGCRIYIELLKH